MKLFHTLLLMLLARLILAQQQYPVALIPAELREKAHAVVRLHQTEFIVENAGQAITRIKGAITILDEKGESHAMLGIAYNKFTKVNDLEAQLYNAEGEKIKRLKRGDIENFSTSSSENSIDDSFVKAALLRHTSYPYTVVFTYEYTSKNMMFYPTWQAYPYNIQGTAIEKSSFTVSMPQGLELRFKEQNLPSKAVISDEGAQKTYRWEVANLKAIEAEPNAPDLDLLLPSVFTGPTDFEVESYKGKLSSWDDLGRFYGQLNKDRYVLPPNFSITIKEQTKTATSNIQKIQKLYEYLQANTRYVSIQLGIGGWQSMPANEVATKGYGDCKALTTYMGAMLREIGIKSYPALVRAGEDEADIHTDFPSFQFNHVFLCVPLERDTLWLECTSQNNPFSYLGSFTSDRHAVLILENGGKLVKTPICQPDDNQQLRHANVKLLDNGEAAVEMSTIYTGIQQEDYAGVIHQMGPEDQKKWLLNSLSLPSVEIQKFTLKESRQQIPSVEEALILFLRNVCNKSGTRIFFTPNLLNQFKSVPLANPNRKFELDLNQNFADFDSITFEIPKNYGAEYLPEPVKIESKFGVYQSSVQLLSDKIIYVRRLTMHKGRYPVTDYNSWVDFRKRLAKADKNQVVLVQK